MCGLGVKGAGLAPPQDARISYECRLADGLPVRKIVPLDALMLF